MKFSENWLRDWVNPDVATEALAEQLTMAGLEVDDVTPVAGPLNDVVVGRVESIGPHPDADKLRICQVNDGSGQTHQVVCGAANAAEGLVAPFARVGATLPGGIKIRKARLRGVESFGMLCSARELRMGEDHDGLLALPTDLKPGADIVTALQLEDHAIDVDLTPNRADCLSIRGIARDVAAINGVDLCAPAIDTVEPAHDDTHGVVLEAGDDCLRFASRVIRGVDPTRPSPLWMAERLRRAGIRPVSAIVDATQYVMLELGQPMHAYDLNKLKGDIVVRRAREGEQIKLLDLSEHELDDSLLAITDDSGVIGLAGIMGGDSTRVDDDSTDILIESAFFTPAAILGRARDLGMHTDASHRFERGVDPTRQGEAVHRVTRLILDICGGNPGPVRVTESDALTGFLHRKPVSLRQDRLIRIVGCEISQQDTGDILKRLEMGASFADGVWTVTPPPHRFDIAIEEDLIEEVVRIWGYNRVPDRVPEGRFVMNPVTETRVSMNRIRDHLVARDWQEAMTWSFVSDTALSRFGQRSGGVELANPLSEDMAIMRTTLLPGLLEALTYNRHRQQSRVRLFECGVCFSGGRGDAEGPDNIRETQRLGLAALGPAAPEQWGIPAREMDFFDLKGEVEALLTLNGEPGAFHFEPCEVPWLHPGRAARLKSAAGVLGTLGALHPRLQQSLELEESVWVAELDLPGLRARKVPNFRQISKFPSIRRDLAFFVDTSVSAREIQRCIQAEAGEMLMEVRIFDIYEGRGVPDGQRSIAVGLILQDASRTLTDSDANALEERLIVRLKEEVSATLRGNT